MRSLDLLDVDVALRQPATHLSKVPPIGKERVPGQSLFHREVVEIDRKIRREKWRAIRWLLHAPPHPPCTNCVRTVRKRRPGIRAARRSAGSRRTRADERTRRRRASRAWAEDTGRW